MKAPTSADVDALARTIWGEARGEGSPGMYAVARVIINRADRAESYAQRKGKAHPLFGDGSLEAACRSPWQFSCWNKTDPNLPKMLALTGADAGFVEALNVAVAAIADSQHSEIADPTGGAMHYYERHIPPPAWVDGATLSAEIGSHRFYTGVK